MRRMMSVPAALASRMSFRASAAAVVLTLLSCYPVAQSLTRPAPLAEGDEIVVRVPAAEMRRIAREIRSEVTGVATAPGLELRLWASEALVADPTALTVDDHGRVHYTRTTRTGSSEFDIRSHRDWMIESITWRTVEDRRAFLRAVLAPEDGQTNTWFPDLNQDGSHDWRDLTVEREHIYRLEDSSRSGVADVSRLLAADFNTEVSDVALSVMVDGDDLLVTVAPDLWRLQDLDGDGIYETKISLSHGFGVHIGFGGHGLSGIRRGPDGRIYWSVGDIGANIVDSTGRRWEYPNQGVVVRAEPDGSGFEVFAGGLRNVHEFDFDDYGNLISVDNDGDHSGERERVVYLVDGSDSGWRINWQFGKYTDPLNNAYKVWMDEGLWQPRFEGQAAYILPPIASYHAGPSGLVYNPGTALGPEWRNHFFVSAFTGSPNSTRINAFRLEPEGAGFSLARDTVLVSGILTTGLAIGPEGALYLADWGQGWQPNGFGRIWTVDDPTVAGSAIRRETAALLAADLGRRSEADLRGMLSHVDRRVRQKAQFELVDRGAAETLLAAATQREHQLARIHGIWGIGQLARRELNRAAPLRALLTDADPEIRAQAAKIIGDVGYAAAGADLVPMLRDASARTRFFAAEALGRISHREAVQPLIAMLAENDDRDEYLRHAGSLALARIGDAGSVVALVDHPSRSVRIAAVVALRRMGDAGVGRFLLDADEYIVTEAARAINDDESIPGALPALALMLEQSRFSGEALMRRSVNANLRLGTAEAARRLAAYAARPESSAPLRTEAVAALGVLPRPSVLDRVDGSPRGAIQRDPAAARAALATHFPALVASDPAPLRIAAIQAAGSLGLTTASPLLLARATTDATAEVRIAALRALAALESASTQDALRAALRDADSAVRTVALGMIPTMELPDSTMASLLASVVGQGSAAEQQRAITTLGELGTPAARAALGNLLDQLAEGRLQDEIHLELFEAVEAGGSAAQIARVEQIRAARGENPMAAFAEALLGGDRARGQQVVVRHEAAQCTRCHTFDGVPGDAPVGPDLAGIGSRLTRLQLLEALVDPGARLAPGFDEGGFSSMPPMQYLLSRREIRDVVEYLSTLQ